MGKVIIYYKGHFFNTSDYGYKIRGIEMGYASLEACKALVDFLLIKY